MAMPILFFAGAATAGAGSLPSLAYSAVPSAFPASFAAPAAVPVALSLDSAWAQAVTFESFGNMRGAAALSAQHFAAAADSPARGRRAVAGRAKDDASTLFKSDLWDSLKAPDAAVLENLAGRIPRLKRDAVRELPFEAIDAILSRGVDIKSSALDIFTDSGLRQRGQLFYLSQATLKAVGAKYRLYILTPFTGKAKDGESYACEAIVMGAGKIEFLYDRDEFEFDTPDFKGHTYKAAARITETIQAPGDLKVEGIEVAMFMHPKIERIVKISEDTLRAETNWGSEEHPLRPIVVRRNAR
ncbi:MAG: hypothetical protein ACHQ49_10320 [Elusimicrobiota bacterium]